MTLRVAIVAASTTTGAWVRSALDSEREIDIVRGTTLFDFSPVRLRDVHVLIIDHALPFEVARQLMRAAGSTSHDLGVIVVDAPADSSRLIEYIEHGLRGYVLESEPRDILVDVVRTVASGNVRLDSWLAGDVVERYRQLLTQVGLAENRKGNGGRASSNHDE